MNQPVTGRVGVPGGVVPSTSHPGVPEDQRAGETDRLLSNVEDDLGSLDHLETADQVPVYDHIHTTLADALARTADAGMPPGPGDPGA